MASYTGDKAEILLRLRKMEGQIKGIRRMVEEDTYCVDVLNQLYSISAASRKVATIVLKDHIRGCVSDALARDDNVDNHVNELMDVVERHTRR